MSFSTLLLPSLAHLRVHPRLCSNRSLGHSTRVRPPVARRHRWSSPKLFSSRPLLFLEIQPSSSPLQYRLSSTRRSLCSLEKVSHEMVTVDSSLVAKGLPWVLCVYGGPLMVVNGFLVLITFLRHTHPSLPHYDSHNWSWLRGALAPVDRDYGLLNKGKLNITDTHVTHH